MIDMFFDVFLQVDEMKFVLEENAFSRPPRVEMEGMASSFKFSVFHILQLICFIYFPYVKKLTSIGLLSS